MKIRGLVVAAMSVLALGGRQGDPTKPTARPTPPPSTTHQAPAGLAQIVTKAGRYTFGEDLAPGYWDAMALGSTCNYITAQKSFDNSRRRTSKLAAVGGAPMFDNIGLPVGILALRLKFSPGDVLEIPVDQFQPNSDVCQFWNNGTDADWADEHDLADRGEFLDDIADTVGRLRCCVPEAVRDIAATLPVRGIDYGEDR
jgi:hypothetical protein